MNDFSRRDFIKFTTIKTGSILMATAIPFGLQARPANAQEGAVKYEVVEGYSTDPAIIHEPKDLKNLTKYEKLHVPILKMPIVAEDGSVIPFYVESDHPMEKDHYIESVEIVNFRDPIVHKGKIHFTPYNGVVYFSSQIRAVSGTNKIIAIMKCNKHGRWAGSAEVKVTVGGC
ncbi:hypothetical protein MNBD_NITROSPINAE02-1678 [hydrothermal vent metagenome]|uniref:Ig-like SoxY domain-containing protein n=1 Tax=hydrothermal vent metagenome TaxID=652676 RepID=A0A3B1D8V9_9ZZZZ